MGNRVALVTGAGGEMGHLLVPALRERGFEVVAVDLAPLPPAIAGACREAVQASILDADRIGSLFRKHEPERVFHLAAVLSTKAEQDPDLATDVNLGGTLALFRLSRQSAERAGRDVRFLFPSSIAVYGFPDARAKAAAGAVREDQWDRPRGLYGIHKRQCEMSGEYFAARARRTEAPGLDFRALRFPGLLSSETVPSGGTSDYGPEMMHAAAQGRPYSCFVEAETRLPFMTMRDAVYAFLTVAETAADRLTTRVYNVRSFSVSAAEIRDAVLGVYPNARIDFEPAADRQAIVDSWPADIDASAAARDWGFAPGTDFKSALRNEFVPALQRRYAARVSP